MADSIADAQSGSSPSAKGSNTSKLIAAGLGIVIIAILIVGVYLLLPSSPATTNTTTTSPTTTVAATQSSKMAQLLSGSNPTAGAAAEQMLPWYSNSTGLSVNYTGGVVLSTSSPSRNVSARFPATLSVQDYLGNTKGTLVLNGIPQIGTFNSISIILTNGSSYNCNTYTYLAGNASSKAPIIGTKYACSQGAGVTLTDYAFGLPASLLFSAQMNTAPLLTKQLTYVGARTYDAQQCFMVTASGSGTMPSGTRTRFSTNFTGTVQYVVSSCLSATYGIPLNLTAVLTGSSGQNVSTAVITLNESYISGSASLAQISALPGPIGQSPGNYTLPSGNSSTAPSMPPPPPGAYASGNETCSGAFGSSSAFSNCLNFSISSSGKVNFTADLANSTLSDVSIGCAITSYNGLSTTASPIYYGLASNSTLSANATGTATIGAGIPIRIENLPCAWGNQLPANLSSSHYRLTGIVRYNSASGSGILVSFTTHA